MKAHHPKPFRTVLPLPGFVLRPGTAAVIAAVHVYLALGHLWQLVVGDIQWTHCWKGFGALAGAYVFAALASRGRGRGQGRRFRLDSEGEYERPGLGGHEQQAEARFSPRQSDSCST
jgi:hypothetical protein